MQARDPRRPAPAYERAAAPSMTLRRAAPLVVERNLQVLEAFPAK
ncbi:hypothetical protein AB0E01_22430 [Nocardia vinacea]